MFGALDNLSVASQRAIARFCRRGVSRRLITFISPEVMRTLRCPRRSAW